MKTFSDDWVTTWVAARIPNSGGDFPDGVSIGVEHDGVLVAGMVYHNWDNVMGTIEMSCAADDKRWLTRPVIHTVLEYPFSFCTAVMARFASDSPARSIWNRIGATETVIPHGRGEGRDMVVATFTRTQWRNSRWRLTDGR